MKKTTICIGENKDTVTAKLISAFVFATRIVQFLLYLNSKFQVFSSFLCLYRSVCVGPVRQPHNWFSHETAHIFHTLCCLNAAKSASTTAAEGRRPLLSIGIDRLDPLLVIFGSFRIPFVLSDTVPSSYTVSRPGAFAEEASVNGLSSAVT